MDNHGRLQTMKQMQHGKSKGEGFCGNLGGKVR